MPTIIKTKNKKVTKQCASCGKDIKVILLPNRQYRGGNYFGKIPFYRKAELEKTYKAGTHVSYIGKWKINVCNYDPKPYKFVEHWECDKCYNEPDTPLPTRI